ncbi:hypothetical protein ACP275_02G055900 [Erythranthe tilingii]
MDNKPGRGYRSKNGGNGMNETNRVGFGLNSRTLLVIRLPDSRALRIVSRSLFLAMLLLALPSLGSIIGAASNAPPYEPEPEPVSSSGFNILPILLRDLVDEGLIKKGHKGFILGAGVPDIEDDFEFLKDAGVDLLAGAADLMQNKKIGNEQKRVFDFVFAPSFRSIRLTDGVLKNGGLVISPLGFEPSNELRLLRDFKIVYLRRFESTVVAMRKAMTSSMMSSTNSVSCGVTPEKKRAALKGLEDVYLEPPRRAPLAKRSSFTSRKIKFLPDLLNDPLNEYPRRVFISDDSNALDWFYKNYPMRNQEFEVYDLDADLIMGDLRPEDYVVMKAEAQVVEQMLEDKTLCLVDELFLECKNQWQDGEEENGSKRAYWQCLALYGKVRDEGIAVHQWWY